MVTLILLIFAAILNACMDMNFNMYDESIFSDTSKFNPNYWNPLISYKNKYKNGDSTQGEKFFLSTTYFVFLTDSWHLFKFLFLSIFIAAIILYEPILKIHFTLFNTDIHYLDYVIYNCIWGVIFEATKMLLKKVN